MGIARSRDWRDGDCSDRDHSEEDIRGTDYRDRHRRGGDSRDRNHSDGDVCAYLTRQMEMMLKGTISGKMAPKGAQSRQLVSGGRALGTS